MSSSSPSFFIKHRKALVVITATILISSAVLLWPISVYSIHTSSSIPQNVSASPFYYAIAESATNLNTSGELQFSVQNFNYTSPDDSTTILANSAVMQVTMTPLGQNETRLYIVAQLNGITVNSPSYSGKVSSAQLKGYVVVNANTNQLASSMTATTSIGAILSGFLVS
jgi:hypothetical protein